MRFKGKKKIFIRIAQFLIITSIFSTVSTDILAATYSHELNSLNNDFKIENTEDSTSAIDTALVQKKDLYHGNSRNDNYYISLFEENYHIGYITGYPDGTIRPEQYLTRAEAAAMICRLIADKTKTINASDLFSDLSENAWYYHEVACLASHGIIHGEPDGRFRPEDYINRIEFTAMAARCDLSISSLISLHNFSDIPTTHWGSRSISTASARGWINGYPNGTFRPNDPITRAEAVIVLNHALDRTVHPEDLPQGIQAYADLSADHWAYCDIMEASHDHNYEVRDERHEVWTGFRFPLDFVYASN